MKKLALFEFFRSIVKNVLIALFLAALCLLITVLYSLTDYEYGKIAPFKSLDIKNGFFFGSNYIADMQEGDDFQVNPENYEGIEAVYKINAGFLSTETDSIQMYAYNRWVWDNWQGRLKSGSWFTESGIDSEEIEIVIGGETSEYSVGDLIYVIEKDNYIPLRIIGVLQDNTEILYREGYNYYENNYQGMYSVPNVEEGKFFVLMQTEAAEKSEFSLYNPCMWEIWEYSDELSEKEAEELTNQLYVKVSGTGKTYDEFMAESEEISSRKVMTYVPTIVVSFILVLAALYCIAYVNVQNNSRYYSIYYLVGASRKKCNILAISYMVITVVLSVIMYVILGVGFEAYARTKNIMYSFVTGPKVLAGVLYLVFAVFLSVCLYMAMRKRTPLDMLRGQKK